MALIFLFDIAVTLLNNHNAKRYPVTQELFQGVSEGETRIHFLNTGNSDCILLESRGRFALVDSGWGRDNPDTKAAAREGYEGRILDYLKRVAADESGAVTLDFVLPTHYHYDHAGGFALILADPAVRVNTVYLNPRDGQASPYTLETRRRMEEVSRARGFAIEEELPAALALGGMNLEFFNTAPSKYNENNKSIVTLITYGQFRGKSFRALLAGDIYAPLEKTIAAEIGGPVDMLKLPHHGYSMSTSAAFLRALRPKLAVVTNDSAKIYPNVMWNLTLLSRTPALSPVNENGLILTIGENGEILATGNLHLSE